MIDFRVAKMVSSGFYAAGRLLLFGLTVFWNGIGVRFAAYPCKRKSMVLLFFGNVLMENIEIICNFCGKKTKK